MPPGFWYKTVLVCYGVHVPKTTIGILLVDSIRTYIYPGRVACKKTGTGKTGKE
jgi:hypothetical protein